MSVLTDVDRVLGVTSPPDLEYLLCAVPGSGLTRFGHAAVRYTLSSGRQVVMNICGVRGKEMVNFLEPSEYLFGVEKFGGACQQGGVYNRAWCGVRVERVERDPHGWRPLHCSCRQVRGWAQCWSQSAFNWGKWHRSSRDALFVQLPGYVCGNIDRPGCDWTYPTQSVCMTVNGIPCERAGSRSPGT